MNKKKKQENVGNTNNNNMYSGRMSVDSLNPRHRNCFLEGPDYPRFTFSRLGTAGNTYHSTFSQTYKVGNNGIKAIFLLPSSFLDYLDFKILVNVRLDVSW